VRVVVLIPSRGRPVNALRCVTSIIRTSRAAALVLVDDDDPELDRYRELVPTWVVPAGGRFTGALNHAAEAIAAGYDALGAFGDDVVFLTADWDRTLASTLKHPGIAYGDDRIHGRAHPSGVFMSTIIYHALGWLALPAVKHQWADDGWKRVGAGAGVLQYMPSVIIEHLHPAVGKAEWDAGYARVFDAETAKVDYDAFMAWNDGGGLDDAIARVRAVR
jgi:hypothetical protein